MLQRALGNTGLSCSIIGFGCGGTFARVSRKPQATMLVHAAIESGINIFDTADVYAEGESERALARALGSKRNKVIIVTKAGHKAPWGRLRKMLTSRKHPDPDYSPDYIERCIVASLRRLNTDYVDVFQLHSPTPSCSSALSPSSRRATAV
jgi:1-deoxyxylulose-5-phosphate synthase